MCNVGPGSSAFYLTKLYVVTDLNIMNLSEFYIGAHAVYPEKQILDENVGRLQHLVMLRKVKKFLDPPQI